MKQLKGTIESHEEVMIALCADSVSVLQRHEAFYLLKVSVVKVPVTITDIHEERHNLIR